ncbi:MAG: adenylosuccinate lyase family protein [Halolamina sp.]
MNPLLGGDLFADVFSTEEMRNLFTEAAFIDRFLEVEAALARAEARAGIVPEDAANTIAANATLDSLDRDRVATNVEEMGLFSMSIIEAWKVDLGAAGEYLHWGASTQDISDTVMVLLLRDAHDQLLRDLVSIRDQLAELADEYRDTPMVGRTQYAHGPPTTFGLKTATWIDGIDRHICRLDRVADRLFVVQLAGASGTLSGLEDNGGQILEWFAEELGLGVPRVGWTATRDRFAEILNVFAMIAGTLSRLAREILFLNRPEIGELREVVPDDELGSSTNPHKQNPVFSQVNVGLARLIRSHADAMNESLEPLGDRDRSAWYVEFALLPASCCYLARLLENTRLNLDELTVCPGQMEQNLRDAGPMILSEAVMIALGKHVGRQTAHSIIRENAMEAVKTDSDFRRCLLEDDRVTEHLSEDDIESLTTATDYTGMAEQFVTSVLNSLDDTQDV